MIFIRCYYKSSINQPKNTFTLCPQVSMFCGGIKHSCGGIIYSQRTVITAGHCCHLIERGGKGVYNLFLKFWVLHGFLLRWFGHWYLQGG